MDALALLALTHLLPATLAFGIPPSPSLWRKQVDAGTFSVTIAGKRAGQERFDIVDVGSGSSLEVRTQSTLALPGGAVTTRGTLRTDPAWRPRGGVFDTTIGGQTTRMTVEPHGDSIETVTKLPGRRAISLTQPPRMPDLYLGTNVLALLTPLCREAGDKERTLTAFPAAPLKISALAIRKYPLTKLGAPTVELRDVVADVARSMRIEVLCDGTKLVAVHQYNQRLTAVRASYEQLASTFGGFLRAKPVLPATLVELPRKVRVGDGTATLGCTLLVPRTHAALKRTGPGPKPTLAKPELGADANGGLAIAPARPEPLPAVVLLGGFGAQDREGNSVGPGDFHLSFFSTLALKLGEAGVASLRCDDRGAGPSAGDHRPARLETLLADAQAELAALGAEPAIDRARLGLVGHSEGALVASMLARRNDRVRALALLAAPGRPVDTIILEQEAASMKRFGRTDGEIATAMTERRATYDAVRDGRPAPAWLSASERRAFAESAPWLRSLFRHDPLADALKLPSPAVFIGQGAKDVQITVKDAELTREAFVKAGNRSVTTKIYPDLNHLFTVSKNDSVADYYDPLAQIDAGFLEDVARFLSTSLAPPKVASR
jgi:pimeloyl-ACP methyl ester carboxylesterase